MAGKLPIVGEVVLPILRGHEDLSNPISSVPSLVGVHVGTWVEDIDSRTFPLITVRRVGGTRSPEHPTLFTQPVVEMTAYSAADLPTTEQMYEDALEVLYRAARLQTKTPAGYLHSVTETLGASHGPSPFDRTWRVFGLIRLGIRPPKN
ncbi:tail terminator [Mycobacterium phage Pari]|uniref:tail terminator n=1 Tax=Mycobacterium phage Pari TaxID=1718171 RepID=UPI000705C343|nr:tail terminator [Mycobacterium phage Pari]ALH46782.1 tail terminator [Mycobacterium phage Pari]